MKPDVKRILAKLSKEKVELSTFSDFENSFDKANGGGEKIGLELISSLRKAEVKYKQNISHWENALKFGNKIEEAYKELGTETPSFTRNQIASCKSEIKEEQKLISAIKGMYGKF
tara:strand:+ start:628 stop:972 length:345 start_codon:yes stop_codon:yes gene_type:complete